MTANAIVRIESISHRYGSRTALDGVSLDVEHGSLFALLGPNGGGKSTLFKILTTLLRPTSGAASIAGADVVHEREHVRRIIGIVFQKPSLDAKLTVGENLRHQGHLYGLSGQDLRRRCEELLERFDLAARRKDLVETLSGGLQRRVELAKSLLHRPRVLVLDEPATGLDPAARVAFMGHLAELRQRDGVTCLLTTHLMDEAERCDRIGLLDAGRLVALDTPAALRQTVGGEVLTISTGQPAELCNRIRDRFGGPVDVVAGAIRMERESGHAFVTDLIEAFPGEIDSVTVGRPTLEDAFVHLTGHQLSNEADGETHHGHGG